MKLAPQCQCGGGGVLAPCADRAQGCKAWLQNCVQILDALVGEREVRAAALANPLRNALSLQLKSVKTPV